METSHPLSEVTYSDDESGGSSVGVEERDVASNQEDEDVEKGEHTIEVSGGGEDEGGASHDASADASDADVEAVVATSLRHHSNATKAANRAPSRSSLLS